MDEQHQIARDLDEQVLAAPAHPLHPLALERQQGRVVRLQRVDARCKRGLDPRPFDGAVEQARRDLDLRQLGHALTVGAPCAAPSPNGPTLAQPEALAIRVAGRSPRSRRGPRTSADAPEHGGARTAARPAVLAPGAPPTGSSRSRYCEKPATRGFDHAMRSAMASNSACRPTGTPRKRLGLLCTPNSVR